MKLSRSIGVALLIGATQAQEDFELARAAQQNLRWIRPPTMNDGMPPLDMADFFANRGDVSPNYSPTISNTRKTLPVAPQMPSHVREKHELEAFGMQYGTGKEPNRWDR